MQTFLPYPNSRKSARCLDRQRLGKQRVEVLQLVNANWFITITKSTELPGWVNHPAAVMWRPYPIALVEYGVEICREWVKRGYKDTIEDQLHKINIHYQLMGHHFIEPKWWGYPQFHESHRSNLLRKNSLHYSQFGWKEPHNLPYYWPTN